MGKVQTLRYKTTIDCIPCIEKIRSILDVQENVEYWYVNPIGDDHILTLMGEDLPIDKIVKEVNEAGFKMVRM